MTEVNKITKSTFKYGNRSYFRTGSEDLDLCAFGKKSTRGLKSTYLAKSGKVSAKNLGKVKVQVLGPIPVSWTSFKSGEVSANINYLTAAGGTGKFSQSTAKKYKLKLVKLSIAENQLEKLLNNHANAARRDLDDEGADGRIVSSVFICMDGEIASKVARAGTVDVSAPAGGSGFVVGVGGGGSSTSNGKIVIPSNTAFAYSLSKVKKWEKRNGERFVKDMEDDWVGVT